MRGSTRPALVALAFTANVGCAISLAPAESADVGSVDAVADRALPDAGPTTIRGPFTTLARARDRSASGENGTSTTWLVLGSRTASQPALLIEPHFDSDGTPILDRVLEIPDTSGWEPVAADRDGDTVVAFFQQSEHVPKLVEFGPVTSQYIANLTSLPVGTPQYAWVTLRDGAVGVAASVVGPGESLIVSGYVPAMFRLEETQSNQLDGYFAAAFYDDADGVAIDLVAITPSHRMDTFRIAGAAPELQPGAEEGTLLPASDGRTLLRLTHDRLVVDNEDVGPLPALQQINGEISVAADVGGRLAVVISADSGRVLVGTRCEFGVPLAWTEAPAESTPGLRGWVAAHADRENFGAFYLETYLGTEQPALRYYAAPRAP